MFHRLLAFSLLLCAAPALAQEEDDAPAPGRTYVVKAVTILDIADGIDIDAEVVRPTGTLLFDRKRLIIRPMIPLRRDFNDAIEVSVDEVR